MPRRRLSICLSILKSVIKATLLRALEENAAILFPPYLAANCRVFRRTGRLAGFRRMEDPKANYGSQILPTLRDSPPRTCRQQLPRWVRTAAAGVGVGIHTLAETYVPVR